MRTGDKRGVKTVRECWSLRQLPKWTTLAEMKQYREENENVQPPFHSSLNKVQGDFRGSGWSCGKLFSWPIPAWPFHSLGYIRGTAREREREGGQTLQPATLREGGDGWGMQTESESGTETHNRRQLQKRDKVGRRLWQGNKHLECPKKSNSASLFLFSVCRRPLQTEVTC